MQGNSNIAHIGFIVKDLYESTGRFSEILKIENFDIYDYKPIKAYAFGCEIKDCYLKIAIAKRENGTNIEIIQPITGATPHMDFIKSGHQGSHHMAFITDDYEKCIENFKNQGVRILFEAEVEDEIRGYRRSFYVEDDKLGCIAEFCEKPRFRK